LPVAGVIRPSSRSAISDAISRVKSVAVVTPDELPQNRPGRHIEHPTNFRSRKPLSPIQFVQMYGVKLVIFAVIRHLSTFPP
jgi:hypothetical protein